MSILRALGNGGHDYVPAWILFAPTSAATFSSAADILRSLSLRSQDAYTKVRPFSPVWRRRSSSASVRILPLQRTSHGARAMPRKTLNRIMIVGRCIQIPTFCVGHWNDIALEVTQEDVPLALVDHERSLSMVSCVLVCFCHDPGRCIRYTLRRTPLSTGSYFKTTTMQAHQI